MTDHEKKVDKILTDAAAQIMLLHVTTMTSLKQLAIEHQLFELAGALREGIQAMSIFCKHDGKQKPKS